MKEGFLRKKENVILEISLLNQNSSTSQTITVDVEDTQAQNIVDLIEKAKNFNPGEQWQALSFPKCFNKLSYFTV